MLNNGKHAVTEDFCPWRGQVLEESLFSCFDLSPPVVYGIVKAVLPSTMFIAPIAEFFRNLVYKAIDEQLLRKWTEL